LLYDVRQFVPEQLLAGDGTGVVTSGREDDVTADRVRIGAQRPSVTVRPLIGMHPDAAEIEAPPRLPRGALFGR